MKKKYFILVSSILASTVLASIGFASWLVTGNTEINTDDNDIIVDDITDGRMSVDYSWANGGSVVFGWVNYTSPTGNWLLNNDNLKLEKLTDTLNLSITNASYLSKIEFTLTVIDNANGGWATAEGNNYVVAPTFSVVESGWTVTDDVATYSLPVAFSWGEAFDSDGVADENLADNLNPYKFYNSQEYSDSLADTAYDTIDDIHTCVSGVKFKLTVKAYTKTTV